MLSEMVNKLIGKLLPAQDGLTSYFMPDGLANTPAHELSVFLLCLPPLSAKLPKHPVNSQTRMSRFSARRGPVAAPFPCLGSFYHLSPDRIQDNISAYLEEMAVFLNKDRFISSLEKVTGAAMQFVKELSIDAVQLPHSDRKITVGSFNEQMIVIVQEAVGMADPVVALDDVLEGVQKIDSVLIALEDGLLFIPPGGDVIDSAGILDS